MTPEELDQALRQKPRPQPAPLLPASVQPLSQAIGCSDEDALRMAEAHHLLDDQGQLHCWNCRGLCPWHVSLHCDGCRKRSIASEPDRRRQAYQAERERRTLELQSQAPRRAANDRQFR